MTDEINEIRQTICNVGKYALEVVSGNMKYYKVKMSDRVRLTMTPEPGDTAIIKTFPDGWLVVDIEERKDLGKYDTEYESEEACFSEDMVNRLKVRRKLLIRKTRVEVAELERQIDIEEEKELERQRREIDEIFGDY